MSAYYRIYVGKLPRDVREREIDREFSKYGRIREIVVKYPDFAFVEYDDDRDARGIPMQLFPSSPNHRWVLRRRQIYGRPDIPWWSHYR